MAKALRMAYEQIKDLENITTNDAASNIWLLLKVLGIVGIVYSANGLRRIIKSIRAHRAAVAKGAKRYAELQQTIQKTNELPKVDVDKARLILKNSSVSQLSKLLETNQVTSEEILLTFLQQIREVANDYNPVIDLNFQQALAQAKRLDQERTSGQIRSKFHGIPISVKDNVPVKDMSLTLGCAAKSYNIMKEDALIVSVLKEMGAIIHVKGTMPILGLSTECRNRITGTTLNAWNKNRTSGGSSGGDATLVALRCTAAAIGSDIGGSIRIPSMFQGLCGLKPTTKRLSDKGPFPRTRNIGVEASWGPLSRKVEDLNLMMSAFCSKMVYDQDPTIPRNEWQEEIFREQKPLVIGYVQSIDLFPAPVAYQNAVNTAKNALQGQGHTLVEFQIPDPQEALMLYFCFVTQNKSRLVNLEGEVPISVFPLMTRFMTMPKCLHSLYVAYCNRRSGMNLGDYFLTLDAGNPTEFNLKIARLYQYQKNFREAWQKAGIDALILPLGSPAYSLSTEGEIIFSLIYASLFNLLDYPAGVVPITTIKQNEETYPDGKEYWRKSMQKIMKGSAGLPVGVQIVALPYQEERCLNVMRQVEEALPFNEAPNVLGLD